MNKWEKAVIASQLDSEESVLKELEKQYRAAIRDIDDRIKILMNGDQTQSRIYQLEYQKTLRKQVSAAIDKLTADNYTTIEQYLAGTYTDAFVGTMYGLHVQGIPIIVPIDKEAAVKAVMTDSKLSDSLYKTLEGGMEGMKQKITSTITRGIASGASYDDMSRQLQEASGAPLAKTKTIVRTEGHRIQQASADDARLTAKSKGADVVKQWDATLDGSTRDTHRKLDGQIRQVDEPFEVDGMQAMYPGEFGDPAEDCNCRCVALTRASWALDEDELDTLKERADYYGIDKSDSFVEFKYKYMAATDD